MPKTMWLRESSGGGWESSGSEGIGWECGLFQGRE